MDVNICAHVHGVMCLTSGAKLLHMIQINLEALKNAEWASCILHLPCLHFGYYLPISCVYFTDSSSALVCISLSFKSTCVSLENNIESRMSLASLWNYNSFSLGIHTGVALPDT